MSRETVNEAVQASDAIAALDTPTASDYWWALHGYTPEAIGAAALDNSGFSGGTIPSSIEVQDSPTSSAVVDVPDGSASVTIQATADDSNIQMFGSSNSISLNTDPSRNKFYAQVGATVPIRIDPSGYLVVALNTAPADGALDVGEMALWFDSTNGSARLMIKAKQADGTVKTGSVSLT